MMIMRIKDLQAITTLGVYEWEREAKRLITLNIELHISCNKAGKTDDINDAVDYAILEQKILSHLSTSSYNLLEKLVCDIGNLLFSMDSRIIKVSVEVDKAGALRQARSVSVFAEFFAPIA